MKKALVVLGVIFVVLVVATGAFVGYAAYAGSGLDKSSKAYVDENVPAILSTWSKDELLKRSSPQLLNAINEKPEQLQKLFEKLSKLGALRHYDGAKGEATVFYDAAKGKMTTAAYVADATFEHGEAHIVVRLVQISSQWQFSLLNVNSPFFLQ